MLHETLIARLGWCGIAGQVDVPKGCEMLWKLSTKQPTPAEVSGRVDPTTGSVLCSRSPEVKPWALGLLGACV